MARLVAHLINLNETPANPPFSGAENHLWVLLPALAAARVPIELIVLLQSTGPAIEARLAELTAAGIASGCLEVTVGPGTHPHVAPCRWNC